jgi:hypothetical protein
MPIADYAHWNEEAQRVWWEEEGRHEADPSSYEDPSDLDALDCFCEEASEWDDETIRGYLTDPEWCVEWPSATRALRAILADRPDTKEDA